MRALTLTQPWASLVASGEKRIETRSWMTRYRGPLAIHAAAGGYKRPPEDGALAAILDTVYGDTFPELPLGGVVAVVDLAAVHPTASVRIRSLLDVGAETFTDSQGVVRIRRPVRARARRLQPRPVRLDPRRAPPARPACPAPRFPRPRSRASACPRDPPLPPRSHDVSDALLSILGVPQHALGDATPAGPVDVQYDGIEVDPDVPLRWRLVGSELYPVESYRRRRSARWVGVDGIRYGAWTWERA